MPTTDEWIAEYRRALAAAREDGDKEREAACRAELEHLGAPEKAVKAAAPERATKKH
ncbi:MAG TPA: hypothetical protein VFH56_07350 [Acidimicrobiales bacterium]|nr:hypothetical protein [Acidimicrobiales bacterium]